MLRLLCAASAAFLVLGLSAHGARPESGSWLNTHFEYQLPVEQQTPLPFGDPCTYVINPTAYEDTDGLCTWGLKDRAWTWVDRCIWDADDAEKWVFTGNLAPGESVSIERCSFADGQEKLSYIRDENDHPSMKVTATIGDQSVTGQREACILGPDYDAPLNAPEIPGSNGGHAFLTPVTFTVTNVGTKTIRRQRVTVYMGIFYWTDYNSEWAGNRCRDIAGPWFGFNPAWRTGIN